MRVATPSAHDEIRRCAAVSSASRGFAGSGGTGRGWELSDRIKINPSHGLKHGGWRLVAIRIRVRDGKPNTLVRVDDVIVDPRVRG